jgi:membrane associated rhomboid family serine protease
MKSYSKRKCPTDGMALLHGKRVPGIMVDHCGICGGIFYDEGELERQLGHPLNFESWESSEAKKACACPHCEGQTEGLERGLFQVYHCTRCRGIWVPKQRKKNKAVLSTQNKNVEIQNPLRPSTWKNRTLGGAHDDEVEVHHYLLSLFGFPYEYNERATRLPMATLSLLFLNIVIFFMSLGSLQVVVNTYGFNPTTFGFSTFYTLFTSMFLHASLFHLLGNMYFLWVLGDNVEDHLGSIPFLLLYLFCGLAGHFLFALLASQINLPSVGASGAIAGLMGAYLYLFPHARFLLIIFFVPFQITVLWMAGAWIFFEVLGFLLYGIKGVNYLAHIGGFVTGLLGIYSLTEKFKMESSSSLSSPYSSDP